MPQTFAMMPLDGEPLDAPGRVVVAMSGGVDSSVTAALLVAQGHEVVGITLRLYDHGRAVGKSGACCAGPDIEDARRVADQLGIAHYVLDYERRFAEAVIDDFVGSYLVGETPNPCVRCNQRIKFGDLLAFCRELGAGALATGHYARRLSGPDGPELHQAMESARDQSYFLFATTREQLSWLRFPLGSRSKAEARELAVRLSLPVAAKPDSQDICFVPDGDYAAVVAARRPDSLVPGAIVDQRGHELGQHHGIIHYTVGQRRGLGLGGRGGEACEPLFVLRLEPETNRVVVGPRAALACQRLLLRDLNWLGPPLDAAGLAVTAKLRSTQPALPAIVYPDGEQGARLQLDQPQFGVAPGQAGVLYQGSRVIGGGWIAVEKDG